MGSKVMGRLQDPLDTLPIGTIMWFEQAITSIKWQIYEPLVGKYPLGVDDASVAGTTVDAGLPNITGHLHDWLNNFANPDNNPDAWDGAFYGGAPDQSERVGTLTSDPDNTTTGNLYFDASKGQMYDDAILLENDSRIVYGKSNTVTPPSVKLLPYIKIA